MSEPKMISSTEEELSTRYEKPIRVDATPEQLIQAIVQTPPKKPGKWKFMRRSKRTNL